MNQMKRYTLVAYLDAGLMAKVRAIQREISRLTGSRASLDDWDPHISVGSEVWLRDDELDEYTAQLADAVAETKPFSVNVRDFGFIDNWSGGKLPGNTPYGVYLGIVVAPELQRMVKKIRPVTAPRNLYYDMPWPYHPHLTVAFRDLTKHGYEITKEKYHKSRFNELTTVDSISIARMKASGRNVEARRIGFTD